MTDEKKQFVHVDFAEDEGRRDVVRRRPSQLLPHLLDQEAEFIELVTTGSVSKVSKFLDRHRNLNINCQTFDGTTALQEAICNEDERMVQLLLSHESIKITDEHLHAIRQGHSDIITLILDRLAETGSEFHPAVNSCDFSEDITPLILAAHCDNYKVVQLLIERGHSIEKPHPPTCFCDEKCKARISGESLNDSKERITVFKALIQPAYIFNTSSDPILTAFLLSEELEQFAYIEKEFKEEYLALARQCAVLPVSLVSECECSQEVEQLLLVRQGSQRPEGKMISYPRLGLALDCEQKKFIAHSSVQHVLRTAWLDDWGDWKKLSNVGKLLRVVPRIVFLPLIALLYILFPDSKLTRSFKSPINKFLIASASYTIFLVLLLYFHHAERNQFHRGAPQSTWRYPIMVYVVGLIWLEIKQCWFLGLKRHFAQWWNLYDIVMLSAFVSTFAMWYLAEHDANRKENHQLDRKLWEGNDPTLVGEGFLAIASVLAFGRLLFVFQVSQDLGPLQVSFSRMFRDIAIFLSLFLIVITSFTLGMGTLYEFYDGSMRVEPNGRKFYQASSFVSYQAALKTLFWSIFAMSPFESADVIIDNAVGTQAINKHLFTEAVGYILFGVYHVIVVIVLLNLLIAMMSNSYQHVHDNQDVEWKVARTKVWLSYFDEGSTLPPPFNLIPTPKTLCKLASWFCSCGAKRTGWSLERCCYVVETAPPTDYSQYDSLMVRLIQRYLNTKEREERAKAASLASLDDVKQLLKEVRMKLYELVGEK